MSLALGPMGRSSEAAGALNTNGKLAAMWDSHLLSIFFCPLMEDFSIGIAIQDLEGSLAVFLSKAL